VALTLGALFSASEALCSVFVSVYLWINCLDFGVICQHYLALYVVTPIVFILAGWYSAAHDRLHVYRLGLVLYAAYYTTLLVLRERSPEYAVPLGILLGVTWGCFWAGSNTFNFDVTVEGKREYYLGLLVSISGASRLLAPLVSGFVIHFAHEPRAGYHRVFAIVVVLYLVCAGVSFLMPPDNVRRPFRLRRALFPGKDQRDWQLIMLAAVSQLGSFNIFIFLLGLLMYMQTGSELSVGGYASFQALAGVIVAYLLGRAIVPRTRRAFMRWGMFLLLAAGVLIAAKLTVVTLIIFGFLRAASGPMFGIAHAGLRLDTITQCAEDPAQRIEYLSAWEVPLALGRIIMMVVMIALCGWLSEGDLGVRITLFILCAARIVTYFILTQTSPLRAET